MGHEFHPSSLAKASRQDWEEAHSNAKGNTATSYDKGVGGYNSITVRTIQCER